jgi:hypothetical protein
MITMSNSRDIAYGRHSLIPECCIAFFIGNWERELADRTLYWKTVYESDWGYVPCPQCLVTRTRVPMRYCLRDCKRECWKDFK